MYFMEFLSKSVITASIFSLCFSLSSFDLSAQGNNGKANKNSTQPSATEKIATAKKSGFGFSDLYADKVPTEKLKFIVDSIDLANELDEEELMYPAEELYEDWNTERVNPYMNAQVPDSFKIDVSKLVMPICDPNIRITSNFGPRWRRMHYGTDLKVEIGDTIYAVCDGKVRIKNFERRGYGNYLVLRHNNGLETVYGHLSDFLVDADEVVKKGQPIALGGNTGRSTGPHLHFETRFMGKPINPVEIFDFHNQVMHRDSYLFVKAKIEKENKYTATGNNKIAYHRVKKGDTLAKIAKRYGVSVKQICKINKISTKTKLRAGQVIRYS